MLNASSIAIHTANISRHLCLLAYPRLRDLPRAQWPEALRRARAIEFDLFERLAVVAALGATAWLLQSFGTSLDQPFLRYLLQFLFALPVLCVLTGPILMRRTRRGLEVETDRCRYGSELCPRPAAFPMHDRADTEQKS